MNKTMLALAVWLGGEWLWAQETGTLGSISGRVVVEDDGSALAGSRVTAYWIDERFGRRIAREMAVATTDGQGGYTLRGLRAGEWVLCPDAAEKADLIAPCEWWGHASETVKVRAGGAVAGADRAMARGRLVEVEVDDPGGHLDANEKLGTGVHLLAGVWGPNKQFHTAQRTSSDKKSRTYAVVIPFDTPVGLEVKGRKLDLDDDKGKAKKDTDPPEMLTEARSASRAAKKVMIKVKGVKP